MYFSAMAMALPWPDRYSSTAFCRISSLYLRLWAFPFSESAETPSARYRLIQVCMVEWPTPARRAASRILIRPARHSWMSFSFSAKSISIRFPIFLPSPSYYFPVCLLGSISLCPEAFHHVDEYVDCFARTKMIPSDLLYGEENRADCVWLSVVIPTFQRGQELREAIQSVLTQETVEYTWEFGC